MNRIHERWRKDIRQSHITLGTELPEEIEEKSKKYHLGYTELIILVQIQTASFLDTECLKKRCENLNYICLSKYIANTTDVASLLNVSQNSHCLDELTYIKRERQKKITRTLDKVQYKLRSSPKLFH
jgi:hypothetical protein